PMTTHQAPTTDTKPAEFASFLVGHLGGRAHDQISAELHELLAAVAEHGKKGSLTVTVTVEPPRATSTAAPWPSASNPPSRPPRPSTRPPSTSSTATATPP